MNGIASNSIAESKCNLIYEEVPFIQERSESTAQDMMVQMHVRISNLNEITYGV